MVVLHNIKTERVLTIFVNVKKVLVPMHFGYFLATSHGKRACNGVGDTVKRLTAKASLQKLFDNQILNTNDMFKFCKGNISGIILFFYPTMNWKLPEMNLNLF